MCFLRRSQTHRASAAKRPNPNHVRLHPCASSADPKHTAPPPQKGQTLTATKSPNPNAPTSEGGGGGGPTAITMSAVVCGKRASSFFEELSHGAGSPPAAKRARCVGSVSAPLPTWPRAAADPALIADLSARFPAMSLQLIEKALEASGNDLDSAVKSLLNLHLGPVENNGDPACEPPNQIISEVQVSVEDGDRVNAPSENVPCSVNLLSDGSGWVGLLVNEMASASNMEDAKARAARALEAFQKDVIARGNAQAPHEFQKENIVLKEQLESLIKENAILKRAFAIQHERQKDYDEKNQELQQMKQHVTQYQERVRNLEVNNYALSMHLRQAQQSSSIRGRHHPDVY